MSLRIESADVDPTRVPPNQVRFEIRGGRGGFLGGTVVEGLMALRYWRRLGEILGCEDHLDLERMLEAIASAVGDERPDLSQWSRDSVARAAMARYRRVARS